MLGLRGKKANLFDAYNASAIVGTLLFIFLIVGLVLYNFGSNAAALASFNFTEGQSVLDAAQTFPTYVDWVYPFLMFSLLILSIFFAYRVPSNSAFFIFAMFAVPLIMFLIIILSKIVQTIFEAGAFGVVTAQMPITTFMLSGINPLIAAILYMMLTLIALYSGKDA